ncbi:hypothetical protein LOK49_LG09G01417 [Camellia lanceoleosa]|uniref:Uncharacterized protein n=1 Tax=Camellia lanceoleosa TaxID=1840588 RepID=A0ACC0GMS1_9ERIC|nr:hypothetical protein LOK49_LG09G01417 [Camellia lanceoleosa]
MEILAKLISSSLSKIDKFPPPLIRFLRSNVGSKSRGKSRPSPMFMRKNNTTTTSMIETTQEPSSPKVTCIGQVRANVCGFFNLGFAGKLKLETIRQKWKRMGKKSTKKMRQKMRNLKLKKKNYQERL